MSDTIAHDSPSVRWRLDLITLTSFAAVGGATYACFSYPPFFGSTQPTWLTSLLDPLVRAVGWSVFALLVVWLFTTIAIVMRRHWLLITTRTIGWLTLTLATSIMLDRSTFPYSISVFGAGGSIGAFARLFLDEKFGANSLLVTIGITLLGVILTADRFVWSTLATIFTACWRVCRIGNRIVDTQANKVVESLAASAQQTVTLFTPNDIAPSEPSNESQVEAVVDTTPIPIISHAAQLPPLLKLHEPEEPLPPPTPTVSEPEYQLPSINLLADADAFPVADHESTLRDRAALLEKTFADFAINVKVVGIHTGPVITQYEIALETGLRLNKVTNLSDDIALKLKVPSVRIVAPLPGRDTVGIEVPNDHRQTVRLKELILASGAAIAKMKLPTFLGKDVEGRPLVHDLADMPHLLIAGRTGTGKSVCLNTVLLSFLYSRTPDECRLILIDPKQVEFSSYASVPHLMCPVVTKNEKAEAILSWAVDKMEERYELLRRTRVRNILSYNQLGLDEILRRAKPDDENERAKIPDRMPYVVIVIDEVGDLIMAMKKEVESHIIRLAQKSRAAGIHLILATQRPTVDVVTGLIKSNLPARICFQVASRTDSSVVLDEKGAEKLLGRGDMLFLQPGTSTLVRGQGAYVDDLEIERVTDAIALESPNYDTELLNVKAKSETESSANGDFAAQLRERDELYEQAIDVVIREQRGSTSLLQRALGIGYGRASRLIDFMAEDGIVGAYNGSSARHVLLTSEEWDERKRAG